MRCMTEPTPDQIADESLLLKIGVLAIGISGKCMSASSHEFSPQRFTWPQRFACLILHHVLKTTYRGVIEQLALMPRVRFSPMPRQRA